MLVIYAVRLIAEQIFGIGVCCFPQSIPNQLFTLVLALGRTPLYCLHVLFLLLLPLPPVLHPDKKLLTSLLFLKLNSAASRKAPLLVDPVGEIVVVWMFAFSFFEFLKQVVLTGRSSTSQRGIMVSVIFT